MTLLPLTVKQIVEAFQASDDKADFQIDGVDVKLVGIVKEKTEKVSDVTFLLDDGTGRITCHRCNGMYVKVHGHLKGLQGKTELVGGAKGLDVLVLNYLRQNSERGVHRNELAKQLNMDQTQISAAIEALDSEGLIYSTIDDNHYKCTSNG
ncbi:hypothetical protein ACJIZ3_021745 [Penstemon smallii]|uniref:Replication protein A C-terminal domain-containing protein n=1 Tax=Penstemon smallii TaxID=265156 RepID=A0ABD3SMY9_9LAMI